MSHQLPRHPAAEYFDDTHARGNEDEDEETDADGRANFPCPHCDRELAETRIRPAWACSRPNCPTGTVVEGGVRL